MQNMTGRTGQAEQDRQNRTGRTGQAEQSRQNRTDRIGQAEEERQNWTGRTGQANWTCRLGVADQTGLAKQDCQDRGGIHSRQFAGNLEVFVQCYSLSLFPSYLSPSYVFLVLEFSTSTAGEGGRRVCLHFFHFECV